MGYVFISYSSKNQEEANSIKYLLNSNKIKTWMAPNDIPVGSKYASVIGGAIKGCSCLLLLLTDVSQNSVWVAKEVERAINYKKTIIPVQLEEVILNDEFEMYISTDQILPIKKIDEKAPDIQTLIAAVKTYAGVEEGLDLAQNQEVTVKKSDDDGEIFYTGEIKLPRPKIGDVIGDKYKVLSGIKEYRNFVLYLVVNESANKQWAMEFMNKSIISEKKYVERYAENMDALKKINHPGLPSYVDAVDTPEYFAVIRDYIEGEPLSDLLKESAIFPEDHAIEMMLELVDIAKYLDSTSWRTGIALSAENVMVKPDGTIKLMDLSGCCLNRPPTIDEIEKCANKIFTIGQIIYYAITGLDPRNNVNKIRPIRKINPDFSKGFEYIYLNVLPLTLQKDMQRLMNCRQILKICVCPEKSKNEAHCP